MCSEFIIEDAKWGDSVDYKNSDICKIVLPKYYDELLVLEKNSIIQRKYISCEIITESTVVGPSDIITPSATSYFYLSDNGELGVSDVEGLYMGCYPPLNGYNTIGSEKLRKKMHKDGTPGEYFLSATRTNKYYSGGMSSTYLWLIDQNGSSTITEEKIYTGPIQGLLPDTTGGIVPTFYEVSSGVVPLCDIKGDTIVEKDPDGYWRIIEAPEDIPVESPKIFGIQRDITNPSPEWTRTGDAVGMTATASVGNTAGHSDFDKYMPWAGMVRETLSTGDVMVKIPKFYYRRYREGNIEHIEIADKPVEGFSVHPSFNHAGQEKDFIYIGAYKTSSNNKSISGATPQVNQLRSVMRNNAHSKGEGWNIIDISTLSAIQMLFLVEYATNDSQKAIGRGYVDGNSSILQTGTCDNVLNLTGVPTGTNGKVDAIYRGIEGLWGNIREWIDGINFNNSEIWVCNNPSQYADGTPTNYTKLSYNLINNTGYIIELGIDQGENKHIMLPFKAGGTNSTYYPDYVNGNINNRTWRVLNIGGGLQGNSDAGLFCSYGDFGPMNSHDRVGSRLLYIPSSIGRSGGIS